MKTILKTIKKQYAVAGVIAFVQAAMGALAIVPCVAQQAFTYTQYTTDLAPYNAAYSLVRDESYINMVGKKQWLGMEGAPTTFLATGSVLLRPVGGSVGIVLSHDKLGVEQLTDAQAYYAQSVRLSRSSYLGVSLNGGVQYYNAAYSGLDPYDAKFRDDIIETNVMMGMGLMLYNPDLFYVGISLPRLSLRSLGTASVEDGRHLANRWYFSGAVVVPLGDAFKLKPATLVSYTNNLPLLVDVSATFYVMDRIGLGVNYRNTKEVAGVLSLLLGERLNIGYSYQTGMGNAPISRLGNATHEITLGYRFGRRGLPVLL